MNPGDWVGRRTLRIGGSFCLDGDFPREISMEGFFFEPHLLFSVFHVLVVSVCGGGVVGEVGVGERGRSKNDILGLIPPQTRQSKKCTERQHIESYIEMHKAVGSACALHELYFLSYCSASSQLVSKRAAATTVKC